MSVHPLDVIAVVRCPPTAVGVTTTNRHVTKVEWSSTTRQRRRFRWGMGRTPTTSLGLLLAVVVVLCSFQRWLLLLPLAHGLVALCVHRPSPRVTHPYAATASKATFDDNGDLGNIIPTELALLNLLSPSTNCTVGRMSSTELAYLGDVVYELLIRSQKIWPSKRTQDLQNQVVRLVRAEHQASLLQRLRHATSNTTTTTVSGNDNPQDNTGGNHNVNHPTFVLTAVEEQVLQRGRNAGTKTSHRKTANPVAYQDATALEALIGYLYISDRVRCLQLLQWIQCQL